jgi:LysM repeat protein
LSLLWYCKSDLLFDHHITMAFKSIFLAAVLLGQTAFASVSCDFQTAPDDGDTCDVFANNWGLSVQQLIDLNPTITCPNLDTTTTWCVVGKVTQDATTSSTKATQPTTSSTLKTTTSSAPVTTQPTSTRPTTTSTQVTTTTAAANQPQNSGTVSNCSKFYKVVSGDGCDSIDAKFSISFDQFRSWNPAVNSGTYIDLIRSQPVTIINAFVIGCTNLFVDYYYCVGVPGATTAATKTTATTTAPAASNQPQNSGTASNCNRYYKVQSGDSCDSIDSKFGISLNQLRSWNTAINSGENSIRDFDFDPGSLLKQMTQAAPTSWPTTTTVSAFLAPPLLLHQLPPLVTGSPLRRPGNQT